MLPFDRGSQVALGDRDADSSTGGKRVTVAPVPRDPNAAALVLTAEVLSLFRVPHAPSAATGTRSDCVFQQISSSG